MNILLFIRGMRLLLFPAAFAAMGIVVVGGLIFREIRMEVDYHSRYGEGWQREYEAQQGSLSKARCKMVVGTAGIAVLGSLSFWVYHQVSSAIPGGRRSARRSRRRKISNSNVS